MTDDRARECDHCPDGHDEPTRKPWGAFVSADRDGDGQPTHLYVAPTAGAHVAESDAEWVRGLLNGQAAQPVVVSAEQVEAAAIAMTEPALWDDPWWQPTFHGDTRSPEERREHFRNGVREKVRAALATLPGITVEPIPPSLSDIARTRGIQHGVTDADIDILTGRPTTEPTP